MSMALMYCLYSKSYWSNFGRVCDIAPRANVSNGRKASIWWITISSIKPNRDHIDPGLVAIADCCALCGCILSCHIIPQPGEAGGDNAYRIGDNAYRIVPLPSLGALM